MPIVVTLVEPDVFAVTLTDVKAHLDIQSTTHDAELDGFLAAALELIAFEIKQPVDVTGRPALRFAVLEAVRDMWTGTQTGGAVVGGALPEDDAQTGLFTAGRPALSPYVKSLLAPYLPQQAAAFSFPEPAAWPSW